MKHIEQKSVQVNKNVVKNILIDPNVTLQENLDNQRKLKIRKGRPLLTFILFLLVKTFDFMGMFCKN